jgi:hypothetical protein
MATSADPTICNGVNRPDSSIALCAFLPTCYSVFYMEVLHWKRLARFLHKKRGVGGYAPEAASLWLTELCWGSQIVMTGFTASRLIPD